MIEITNDKALIFTDLHTGIKSNAINRLEITERVVDDIVSDIIKYDIKDVIFVGDFHHDRVNLHIDTMCRSIRMINKITDVARLIFILGNHDIQTNVSTEVNSVKYLEDNPNVELIDKATEILINGHKTLLCPWLAELGGYDKETFDCLIGHFDISHKYLIDAYAEEHKSEAASKAEITNLMIKSGYDLSEELGMSSDGKEKLTKVNSKKHIGKFVDLCKKGGFVYSGHIHQRRNFKLKSRNFNFLGSPLQLTWGDYNKHGNTSDRGYYVMDTKTLGVKFIENNTSPVHRKYFISQLPLETNSLDEIFLSKDITGQFVRVILDKSFEFNKLNEILSMINEFNPSEPAIVDYDFSIDFDSTTDVNIEDNSLRSSKLKYINDYIESLSDESFTDFGIEKQSVLNYVEKYFKQTEESLA